MIKWIWLFAGLLALVSIAAAEEDMSSAQLVQSAISRMGDSSQDAQISGFDIANSRQIGYSWDGNVTQTISYDNIGNGSIVQWGESGDMPREERTLYLNRVGDSGFTWQWNSSKGDVNQTVNVRSSENLYLMQIIGGLKNILFPDPQVQVETGAGSWWFCGGTANGTGGMPLCAEKMAKRIFDGNGTPRDYYMLQVMEEEYSVFPPENLTPHITLTKWNITTVDGNLTIKFRAHNYGKKAYNATLMIDLTPKINLVSLDGDSDLNAETLNWEFKMPEEQTTEIGTYTVPSMKGVDGEAVIPLNGMDIKDMQMRMISE